jgi:hypothetical protein
MKMEDREMKIKYTLLVALVIASMVLVGCGSAEPTPHPGEALVNSKCSTCHGLAQVENATYSRGIWETTVDRMVLAGMVATDEEKALIVDYLALRDAEK